MFSFLKMGAWHCRRMFLIAGVLAIAGYLLAPDSDTGRFWVASLWMFLCPLLLTARYSGGTVARANQMVLHSAGRTRIWLFEVVVSILLALLVSVGVCQDISLAAFAVGLWGVFLCAVASLVEQLGRRAANVMSTVFCVGLLLWASPFWLGSWLGEPGFTPWLASWVMCLHPVSQALTLAGLSNLIEPVFYSLTFIGVVEVELFSPIWGLLLASSATIGIFVCSYVLNRRRSVLTAASFNQIEGV